MLSKLRTLLLIITALYKLLPGILEVVEELSNQSGRDSGNSSPPLGGRKGSD